MCVRQVTPFTFGNPLHWTQPNAYRPNSHLHQPSCARHGKMFELEAREQLAASHGASFPFRFDPSIEGVAPPPQRGPFPEGLLHFYRLCIHFWLRETSLLDKLFLFLLWLISVCLLALLGGLGVRRYQNRWPLSVLLSAKLCAFAKPREEHVRMFQQL